MLSYRYRRRRADRRLSANAAAWMLLTAAAMLAIFAIGAHAQTNSSAVPTVLGCNNPAPAAPGKPTVFIDKCQAPAFVPTTSSSVIASGSKTIPIWLHSFAYYAANTPASTLLIACPKGANVTAGQCTDATGKDVSVLATPSHVASLVLTPATPPPVCPETIVPVTWTCGDAVNGVITCTAPVSQ